MLLWVRPVRGQATMKEMQTLKQFSELLDEKSVQQIKSSMEQMRQLMVCYQCATMEIETKFRVLDEQFSLQHERNPIESIRTRIKSFESIRGKMERKGLPMTVEAIENNLHDIAGVRVICGFVDDIYMLADCLTQQDDITLIEVKDYIASPKPNGYRSLHLIVEIPIFLAQEKKVVPVEVQLRTIAMESWANLEHRLRYKKNIPEAVLHLIDNELNECAVMSTMLDEKMQRVRSIIEDTQEPTEAYRQQ